MDSDTGSNPVIEENPKEETETDGTDAPDENGVTSGEVIKDQEVTRDERGHWQKGKSGNPKGRPKDRPSITLAISRELEKIEPNSKKTWLELVVVRIMEKAVIEGDITILKTIWNYIDGMPKIVAEVKQSEVYDKSMETLTEIIEERRKLASGHETTVQPVQDQ